MRYEKDNRLYIECYNNQNCLMKIVEYYDAKNIVVEFQDKYKCRVHTNYAAFLKGKVKNPYHPSICGVGVVGNKYITGIGNIQSKEYLTWKRMLERCFYKKRKEKQPTYKNVTCCNEWLLYENFYEWLHSQPNFDKWYYGDLWALDKDILIKGNKTYSPETCCLIPQNVNSLFVKNNCTRGDLPIGVHNKASQFVTLCKNPFLDKYEYIGKFSSVKEAFQAYKNRKEEIIKQVAEKEYNEGNITKKCYEAMMNYEVEITD